VDSTSRQRPHQARDTGAVRSQRPGMQETHISAFVSSAVTTQTPMQGACRYFLEKQPVSKSSLPKDIDGTEGMNPLKYRSVRYRQPDVQRADRQHRAR
jgi:hypothetical protein